MTAKELKAKLKYLTFVGRNSEGELEWVGTKKNWEDAEWELEADYYTRERIEDIKEKLGMIDRDTPEYAELWEELQELKSHA